MWIKRWEIAIHSPVVMLLQNFNELNNTSDKLSIFLTSSSTIKKWAKHIKIQVRQGLKCH